MPSRKTAINLVLLATVCIMCVVALWYVTREPNTHSVGQTGEAPAIARPSGSQSVEYKPGQPLRLEADPALLTKGSGHAVPLGGAKAKATAEYFSAIKKGRAQFWETQRLCQTRKLMLNQYMPQAVGRYMTIVGPVSTKGVDSRLVEWEQKYRAGMVQLAHRLRTAYGKYDQCFQALEQLDAQFPEVAGQVDAVLGTALGKDGLGDMVALKSANK